VFETIHNFKAGRIGAVRTATCQSPPRPTVVLELSLGLLLATLQGVAAVDLLIPKPLQGLAAHLWLYALAGLVVTVANMIKRPIRGPAVRPVSPFAPSTDQTI
jgi:hypothetical protein